MKTEIRRRLIKIPTHILDAIYEDYVDEAIGTIIDNYIRKDDIKLEFLKNTIALVVLKDIKIEQLLIAIREGLKLNKQESIEITLIILRKILYPIEDYFPGIEDEILKLGGEIPKKRPKKLSEQLLKRSEEMAEMKKQEEMAERERMADTIISLEIQQLLKEYPEVGKQQIGSQKSILLKDKSIPMKPLIKFWLKDYQEKTGQYQHSNLDRAQYVYHDKNTKNMNEEERRQLNLILKSVDEGISLPYSTKTRKIDFSQVDNE